MGWITEWTEEPQLECRYCGERKVSCRQHEEPWPPHRVDEVYSCDGCRHVWWLSDIDGVIDAADVLGKHEC